MEASIEVDDSVWEKQKLFLETCYSDFAGVGPGPLQEMGELVQRKLSRLGTSEQMVVVWRPQWRRGLSTEVGCTGELPGGGGWGGWRGSSDYTSPGQGAGLRTCLYQAEASAQPPQFGSQKHERVVDTWKVSTGREVKAPWLTLFRGRFNHKSLSH